MDEIPKLSKESAVETAKAEYRKEIRDKLGAFFDEFSDPKKRVAELRKKFRLFEGAGEEIEECIHHAIQAATLPDRASFIEAVLPALEPLVVLHVEHPDKEKVLFKRGRPVGRDYEPLTELLQFEIDKNGWMRLHVPDQEGKSPFQLKALLSKALRAVVAHLEEHPEIHGVVGTSWIVGHPSGERLMKGMGFQVEPVSEETRLTHFPDEKRPIKMARMSREEVIRKFGQREKR